MSAISIYSCAHPLSFAKSLDHTWVTNYLVPTLAAEPISPIPDDQSYWYCWGVYHATTTGQLSEGMADPAVAGAISPPNVPALPDDAHHWAPSSTSGAIDYYGLDGVCHNVANQILAATGTASNAPVTVNGANGYPLSTYFFGTYGLNSAGWDQIVQQNLSGIKLAGDEFLPFLQAAVPADKQAEVLNIRRKAQSDIRDIRARVVSKSHNFYPELFAVALARLGELRIYLGHDVFYALFPSVDMKSAAWLMPPLDTDA